MTLRFLCLWKLSWFLLTSPLGLVIVSASDSSHNDNNNNNADADVCICQVAKISFMQQDGDTGRRRARHALDCLAIPGISPPGFSQMRLRMPRGDRRDSSNDMANHQNELNTGEWWVRFPCQWVSDDRSMPSIDQIQTLTPKEMKQVVSLKSAEADSNENEALPQIRQRRLGSRKSYNDRNNTTVFQQKHHQKHAKESLLPQRRLSNIGVQKCAIVIVDAKDAINPITPEMADKQLYDLASKQFEACSNGAVRLVPQDETVRITLPRNIGVYDDATITTDLLERICLYYGYKAECHIAKERQLDHILFSVPYGLSIDAAGSFWAFASTGDYRRFSVYSGGNYGDWNAGFFVPSTIIHELGHNYRLGHAYGLNNDADNPYGDQTTQMGGGPATHKCFNGYNYFVLGWHGTQTNEIELQPGTAYTYQLYGIGDVQTGNIVNIKAGAYYVTFNLKTGFNREIDDGAEDYANHILIHEGLDIPFRQTLKDSYFDTKLAGNLQTIGDTFEVLLTKGYLKIRVCSIDTTGSNGATLSIGLDNVGCHLDPGQVSSPIGVQTLHNRVPLTGLSGFRNDMFEYRLDLESLSEPVACHSWGGSGDIDMFLNFDSSPAITFVEGLNACTSGEPFTDEGCTIYNLPSTNLFVTIHAFTSFQGVSVMCKVGNGDFFSSVQKSPTASPTSDSDAEAQVLEDGTILNISAKMDEKLRFVYPIDPLVVQSVKCAIGGGTGDGDLYVGWDSPIDFESQGQGDCVPYLHGNNEKCELDVEEGSNVLHLGVLGYRGFEDVDILCESMLYSSDIDLLVPTILPTKSPSRTANDQELVATPIHSGDVVRLAGNAGDVFHFIYQVEPGVDNIRIRLRRGSGNADLFASFDRPNVIGAGQNENDCSSTGSRNQEQCDSNDMGPLGQKLYISVYAVTDFRRSALKVITN